MTRQTNDSFRRANRREGSVPSDPQVRPPSVAGDSDSPQDETNDSNKET